MIEALKNCPNCGGTLNEAGRCSFCGSKVYDFLTIDFNYRKYPSARTYIRMRVKDPEGNSKIVLAPVIVDTVSMTSRPEYDTLPLVDNKELIRRRIETTMDIHCQVINSMYMIFEEEGEDNNE